MFETVTVEQAIKRGMRMVRYPTYFTGLGGICLVSLLTLNNYLSFLGWAIGLILSFVLPWLYWSIIIIKWRLWAFDNVRNVHNLKRKALETQLLGKEGSFFEKTVIRTNAQKQKWQELQKKFALKDVHQQNYLVAPETIIYNSKGYIKAGFILSILALGLAVYLYIDKDYIHAIGFAIAAPVALYISIKRNLDNAPQLILNSKGIETKSSFTSWNDISDEKIITIEKGKSSVSYLEYNNPFGTTRISIGHLNVTKDALEDMLYTYRIRSEKARPSTIETRVSLTLPRV